MCIIQSTAHFRSTEGALRAWTLMLITQNSLHEGGEVVVFQMLTNKNMSAMTLMEVFYIFMLPAS